MPIRRAARLASCSLLALALVSCASPEPAPQRAQEPAVPIRENPAAAACARGDVFLEGEAWADAEKEFAAALAADAGSGHAWRGRGHARARQGRVEEALADFAEALRIDAADVEALKNRARALADTGRDDEAMLDLDEAIRMAPGYWQALNNRANLKKRRGLLKEALEDCDLAVAAAPGHAVPLGNRGRIRLGNGDVEGALGDLERSVQLNGEYPEYWYGLALCRERKKQWAKALQAIDQVVLLRPGVGEYVSHRGELLWMVGSTEEGLTGMSEGIRLDPKNATAWYRRGHFLHGQQQYSRARDDFTECLKIRPGDRGALDGRSSCLLKLEDYKGAVGDLDHLVEQDPGNPEFWHRRAYSRFRLGRRDGALEDYREALRVAPKDWSGRKAVEEFLQRFDPPDRVR